MTDPEAGDIVIVLDTLDECSESGRVPLVRKIAQSYSQIVFANKLPEHANWRRDLATEG